MNPSDNERQDLIERYLSNALTPPELEAFETELMTNQRLLDELEAEERLARAMRSLPAEEAAAQRPAGFQRGWALAWAASILLARTPAWLLYRSVASAEAERQRERARASEVAAE
ncbi:MAG: hypothetical protein AAF725_22765, partial [Acidobacteriota bacterium]